MQKVAIVGVGRVGLPFGLYLESLGFKIIGIDKNIEMLKLLHDRIMPFKEEGFQQLLNQSDAIFTDEINRIKNVDYIVITVGTPLMPHIETDLSNIERVTRSIIPFLHSGQCVILRSTVAPKTTNYVKTLIESNTGLKVGRDIGLAFCPERLSEHNAMREFKILPQIIGCDDEVSHKMASNLFAKFNVKILKTNYISAELAKLFNNSVRYVEFAIANQLAIIASNLGQNIHEILKLTNDDYLRGFPYKPGLTAGTCLRKDFGMINELSPGPDLLLAAWKINEYIPYYLTELAEKHTKLNNKSIAVLGYTFKSNSDDTRDSLVPKLIRYLERYVPRSISICEPNLHEKMIGRYENVDLAACLKTAEVIFIAINHDEFKDREYFMSNVKNGAIIVDLWNCLKNNEIIFVGGGS